MIDEQAFALLLEKGVQPGVKSLREFLEAYDSAKEPDPIAFIDSHEDTVKHSDLYDECQSCRAKEEEDLSILRGRLSEYEAVSDAGDWYAERIDHEDGEIRYESHGPRESFIRFEGPNAKSDCTVFMKAVNGSMCE